jgi:hypothetical protein
MTDLNCPRCGSRVPEAGMPDPVDPWRQVGRCPECDVDLVRDPESDASDLRGWRLAEEEEFDG